MALHLLEPDIFEVKMSIAGNLPSCPFCGDSVSLCSKENRTTTRTIFQGRVFCRCGAGMTYNALKREEAQKGAIAAWSQRITGDSA